MIISSIFVPIGNKYHHSHRYNSGNDNWYDIKKSFHLAPPCVFNAFVHKINFTIANIILKESEITFHKCIV